MKRTVLFIIVALIIWACEDNTTSPEDIDDRVADEFVIVPENPAMKDEVIMIFYGCSYFHTTSVNNADNILYVKKHFNSQLKWPCVAEYDTISFGQLHKGDYEVKLEIIDLNPEVTDSVYYSRTKIVTVSNK